jgi:hypothetical protein
MAQVMRWVASQKEFWCIDKMEVNVSSMEDVFVHVGHDADSYAREILKSQGRALPAAESQSAEGEPDAVGSNSQIVAAGANPGAGVGGEGGDGEDPDDDDEEVKDQRAYLTQLVTLLSYRFKGMIREPADSIALVVGPTMYSRVD